MQRADTPTGRQVPGRTRWAVPLPEDPDAIAERVVTQYERYTGAALARLMRFMGMVTLEWEAHGAVVRDVHGREYVECGGYGQFIHGHSHAGVVAAVRQQAATLALSTRLLPHAPQGEAAELLAQLSPGDLRYSFFCNSGAEAVEGALKLARAATGRSAVLATQGAFHGKTFGALTASGKALYRDPFVPLVEGFHHVPFGDAGRMEAAALTLAAADGGLAAIILEPIQGEGGVIVPPPGYLAAARAICDRLGALLILDEVQTGIGRTGTMFCCEQEGVVPDILATAKSLGGGVMPVGAFIARPDCWEPFDRNPFLHTSTFGGAPLACAAAVAALRAMTEEDLLGAARSQGAALGLGLAEVAARHPEAIVAARGRGLLWGLELRSEGLGGLMLSSLLDAGVLVVHSLNQPNVIRVMPPAVISGDQLAFVLEAIDATAGEAARLAEELRD